MQRLRQNLFLKLVSLGCAFGLFLYVRKAESMEVNDFPVPLIIRTDPNVKVVEPMGTQTIHVAVRGPADVVRNIAASQIAATVDLTGKHTAAAQTVPIQIELAPELQDRNLTVESNRPVIKVRLDEVISRYLQVAPRIDAEAPPGEAIGVPEVHPPTVTVTGLKDVVDRVKQVRAVVTEINGKAAVDVLTRVSAVDDAGTELRDRLQIQPATVKVHIPLERRIWTKRGVYVDPKLGSLPAGTLVRQLSVQPPRVEVTGTDQALADLWVLPTESVEVSQLEGHYERIVRLIPPEGVKRIEPPRVRVSVDLYRGLPATPPRRQTGASGATVGKAPEP